jgi:hypothetical protein
MADAAGESVDPAVADSAGQPWAGRHFEPNPAADDDGSAPPDLIAAITAFRESTAGEADVVAAFRTSRLLIPLVAEAGDVGVSPHGFAVDKTQELSIVTVEGPDGRAVLPVFSSVDAMRRWNAEARPVPAAGPRVALAAAGEGTELVVLDPTSDTEFTLRRPALWAIGQDLPWMPSYLDPVVLAAFVDAAEPEPAVRAVTLAPGDPTARLAGPELVVQLALEPGLERSDLDALMARLQERWASTSVIVGRVDSMRVTVVRAS